jgi:transposase
MADGWLTGWKAIAKHIGLCERTCKRYKKKYSLPVKKLPGGKPSALPGELNQWLINFDKLKNK